MKKLILFIGLLLFAFLNVCAQKEYQIEQVSAINMGDGRILFRDLKTDKGSVRKPCGYVKFTLLVCII